VRRENTYRLELLFSHDPFQTLAGHPLIRGTQRNISQLVSLIEAISAAIAARNMRFAVFGAFGPKNGEDHGKSAAVGGSFGFELFKIGENLGAVEPGSAQDFDWLGKIAARNETAHRPLGNVAQQVGGFLEVNQPFFVGGG
jgi:hypothetical protein